jgi:hypothetical protein
MVRWRSLLALLTALVACEPPDRPAEAPRDRPWPAYGSAWVSGRPADTVHVRYTVDSLGRVDSASVEFVRRTSDILDFAVRATLLRTSFRPAVREGRPAASQVEERYVFVHDSAAAPDPLVVVATIGDSIAEYVLGSTADSRRTMSVPWSDVRAAYRAVLIPILDTRTLTDSLLRGRDATICLGTPTARGERLRSWRSAGRNDRDTAAFELLTRLGRDVVPVEDCRSNGGVPVDAPPPAFTPPPGAPAPVYIEPVLESWTSGAVWMQVRVTQHHGVDVHACQARRERRDWTASCEWVGGYIF